MLCFNFHSVQDIFQFPSGDLTHGLFKSIFYNLNIWEFPNCLTVINSKFSFVWVKECALYDFHLKLARPCYIVHFSDQFMCL